VDNFSIDITAEDRETLRDVLRVVFRHNAPGRKTSHWMELEVSAKSEWLNAGGRRKALVLLWSEERRDGADLWRFPVPLDADGAAEMVWRWLEEADRGSEPDHDGDNGKGFRVYCDFWGHFEGLHYAIAGIVPAWAMYGK